MNHTHEELYLIFVRLANALNVEVRVLVSELGFRATWFRGLKNGGSAPLDTKDNELWFFVNRLARFIEKVKIDHVRYSKDDFSDAAFKTLEKQAVKIIHEQKLLSRRRANLMHEWQKLSDARRFPKLATDTKGDLS